MSGPSLFILSYTLVEKMCALGSLYLALLIFILVGQWCLKVGAMEYANQAKILYLREKD
jgi:hypothetical protein